MWQIKVLFNHTEIFADITFHYALNTTVFNWMIYQLVWLDKPMSVKLTETYDFIALIVSAEFVYLETKKPFL